ncbi:MAG: glutamate racemase [Candidatus Aureabacteria bacterium]|nr:glutamate racemase [Candidatus Auribacterota bacterium]
MNQAPIGIFDSDIGGLSVVHEFQNLCPREKILYFADTANYPYGTKNPDEVLKCFRHAMSFFANNGIKAVLVACSTASAVAFPYFKDYPGMEIVGMLNDHLLYVVSHLARSHDVGIIATELTVKSQAFDRFLNGHSSRFRIHSESGTELVSAITKGDMSDQVIFPILRSLLKNFNLQKLGCLIIGCTHFYHIRDSLKTLLGEVPLIEPSRIASLYLQSRLEENGNLSSSPQKGQVVCRVSRDMEDFKKRVENLEVSQGKHYIDVYDVYE